MTGCPSHVINNNMELMKHEPNPESLSYFQLHQNCKNSSREIRIKRNTRKHHLIMPTGTTFFANSSGIPASSHSFIIVSFIPIPTEMPPATILSRIPGKVGLFFDLPVSSIIKYLITTVTFCFSINKNKYLRAIHMENPFIGWLILYIHSCANHTLEHQT